MPNMTPVRTATIPVAASARMSTAIVAPRHQPESRSAGYRLPTSRDGRAAPVRDRMRLEQQEARRSQRDAPTAARIPSYVCERCRTSIRFARLTQAMRRINDTAASSMTIHADTTVTNSCNGSTLATRSANQRGVSAARFAVI